MSGMLLSFDNRLVIRVSSTYKIRAPLIYHPPFDDL